MSHHHQPTATKSAGNPSLAATWTASEHSLPVTSVHAPPGGGRVYTSSLDRSAKAWDACSGRLLLSVTCPAFLRAVTTDPAEAFLFAGGGGGVIFQVRERGGGAIFARDLCFWLVCTVFLCTGVVCIFEIIMQ